MTYCENYRNLLDYGRQRSTFLWLLRNMGHFLCGVVV